MAYSDEDNKTQPFIGVPPANAGNDTVDFGDDDAAPSNDNIPSGGGGGSQHDEDNGYDDGTPVEGMPAVDNPDNEPDPTPTDDTASGGTEGDSDIKDFIPEEGGRSTTSGDTDMSASVADAASVPVPESTTDFTNLTEDDYLVENRMEELYDRDSPFYEKARQQMTRRHLAAGGQNSAMAAAFGEGAAMETAYKVAFADAKTMAAFSAAEQRFIHNALLSDQAYDQARELQSQRIDAQFEAIRLDFKGKSMLMDKELDQWFSKARQQHQYALDMMWEQEEAYEGREQRGFVRKMNLEGMLAMSEFYTQSVSSVIGATANLKNANQQKASMESGMAWMSNQFDLLQSFWGQWGAGGPPNNNEQQFIGEESDTNQYQNWWEFTNPVGG